MSTTQVMPRVTIVPLAWDSDFFGHPVVRLEPGGTLSLAEAVAQLRGDQRALAYLELDPGDPAAARAAAAVGARLVDRRVELVASPHGQSPADVELLDPSASSRDRQTLLELALASGERSRFRTDRAIPAGRFEALYTAWMDKSIARQYADAVLVVRNAGRIAGMVTVAAKGQTAVIGLFAVEPQARGRGFGRRLLEGALAWAKTARCSSLRVATQGDNAAALAAYGALGFDVDRTADTYHIWICP